MYFLRFTKQINVLVVSSRGPLPACFRLKTMPLYNGPTRKIIFPLERGRLFTDLIEFCFLNIYNMHLKSRIFNIFFYQFSFIPLFEIK